MKKLELLGFLCGIILFVTYSCEKDEHPVKYAVGYIVGYDPCTINHQYRIGYVIITKDLKDTLLTYNLSDSIYRMPASVVFNRDTLYKIPWNFFQNYQVTAYFPDTLYYKFGVEISYSLAKESEKVYNVCSHEINDSDFINTKQVIIKSATKY